MTCGRVAVCLQAPMSLSSLESCRRVHHAAHRAVGAAIAPACAALTLCPPNTPSPAQVVCYARAAAELLFPLSTPSSWPHHHRPRHATKLSSPPPDDQPGCQAQARLEPAYVDRSSATFTPSTTTHARRHQKSLRGAATKVRGNAAPGPKEEVGGLRSIATRGPGETMPVLGVQSRPLEGDGRPIMCAAQTRHLVAAHARPQTNPYK